MFRVFSALNTQVLTYTLTSTLYYQKGDLMEELFGGTISSCVRCHNWLIEGRSVPYEEKMRRRAANGYWDPETSSILCALCYRYCAHRYIPFTGKQPSIYRVELVWLAKILNLYPDVGKVVDFLQQNHTGHIVLGSKAQEEVRVVTTSRQELARAVESTKEMVHY